VEAEIEARQAADVPDVVATLSPLIRTRHPTGGQPVILLPSRRGPMPVEGQPGIYIPMCQPSIYVDGMLMPEGFDPGHLRPEQLAAVELYLGMDTPVEYPDRGGCGGSVLLWTRDGEPGGPALTWGRAAVGGAALAVIFALGLGAIP
jgi:hypothetical protein